jgi:aspartate-semialdehyde dehydrogenase
MAPSIADRSGGRVAVLGAASTAGAHVKAALADRGVPGTRVALYGHQRDVAVLSEYDGEARLVQAASELDAPAYAAIFVCDRGHDDKSLALAAASGTLVVDMTGSIPNATLAGSPAATSEGRVVAVPHVITMLLTALLAPLQGAMGLTRASVFVLRPASDFGEPGLEELREQTVHLLRFESVPTDVFGRQLAFNLVPQHLFPAGEEDAADRVVRECRVILGAPELPIALSVALAPLFFGHAVAAHVDLARPGREHALAAWRAQPGVEIAMEPESGATLDAPEGPKLLVARVDAAGPSSLRVWAVGSEAGATAAAQAIAVGVEAGVL